MWRRITTTTTSSTNSKKTRGERQQAAAPSYLSSEIMFPPELLCNYCGLSPQTDSCSFVLFLLFLLLFFI